MSQFVYPLDGEQNYTASQAGAFNGTRTSGVWAGDGNLQVSITGARQLSLSPGLAWFTTDQFWGKVYANTAPVSFNLPTADAVLDQICRVVIRWDKTANEATAMLLTGSKSSSPSAPTIYKTDEMYDLVLADYYIQHGETSATAARLTDRRLNESLCGLMSDGVTRLPTSNLYNEYEAVLAELRTAIEAAWSGEISPGAVSTFYTATVPANGWSETYGVYVSNVNISGILSADTPMVDIDMEEIDTLEDQKTANDEWGGVFRIKVFDGVLQFYATDAPTADIPIKILCIRK